MKNISIIVPSYNEEKNIIPFFELCKKELNNEHKYEYIFINDGSSDDTFNKIKELKAIYPNENIIGINFSRNFGKESAILAGLNYANGEYISLIDADLQQNPKYINEMVDILEYNDDVDGVSAYQDVRNEGGVLKFFKSLFYNWINKLSDVKLRKDASDFRTFRKEIRDSIVSMNEYNRFSKGIFAWVGYNIEYIPYTVEERLHGKTKWSFKSLTKYAIEGFVGYSTAPLKFSTILGMFTSIISILYLIIVIIQKLFIGIEVEGFATIICLILFFAGVQLLSLGIIGEYLAKTYLEVKKRPHYLIKNVIK